MFYICIYTHRERERDIDTHIYIYIYIYICGDESRDNCICELFFVCSQQYPPPRASNHESELSRKNPKPSMQNPKL